MSRTVEVREQVGATEGNNVTLENAVSHATNMSADELQLLSQGHTEAMPRRFSAFSAFSMAFVVTNSWAGIGLSMGTPLLCGRGPMLFYGALVAFIPCLIITAGLAELASAFPTSGGQYHFTYMVLNPKYRAFGAFVTGFYSVLAWSLAAVTICIISSQIIVSLAASLNSNYSPTHWQVYLITLPLLLSSAFIVCYLPNVLPKLEIFFFWTSTTGLIATIITMLATSKSKQTAHVVLGEYVNQTGWSDGVSFMIGLGGCMFPYLATDALTHMAEEIPNPGKYVPRMMILTPMVGLLTSAPFLVAFLFSADNLTTVATAGLPFLEGVRQATKSDAGTAVLVVWLLLIAYSSGVSCLAVAGRQTWAFARDNGLPFSPWFAKVHPTLKTPVNATVAVAAVGAIYAVIYVGSTAAFSSIISVATIAFNITWGVLVNAFSTLWVTMYTVLLSLPVFYPPNTQDMNYVSVVLVGIGVIILGMWFAGKRKQFVGPQAIKLQGVSVDHDQVQLQMPTEHIDLSSKTDQSTVLHG